MLTRLITKKSARIILLLVGVLSVAAAFSLRNLSFNYDFERLFPEFDEDVDFFKDFREQFEHTNDYLFIGIESDDGIFDHAFLEKIDQLSDTLSKLDKVDALNSPTRAEYLVIRPFFGTRPFLHFDDSTRYEKDSALIYQTPLKGSLFSYDAKSVAMFIVINGMPEREKAAKLLKEVDALVNQFGFKNVHYEGRIKAEYEFVKQEQRELIVFVSIGICFLTIMLIIFFRTWWGVLIPMLTVILAALWQLAFMSLFNIPITLITTMLPTILFVVGMSDAVHILEKYIEELRAGKEKVEAIKAAVKEIGWATFLTSFTTAVGFASLVTIEMEIITEFGLLTAFGVMMAFLMAILILPSVLILVPKPKLVGSKRISRNWKSILSLLFIKVLRKRFLFLGMAVIMIGGSILAMLNLEVDNYIMKDWGKQSKLRQHYEFFENNFAGYRAFDMALLVQDSGKDIYDYEVMQELEKVEGYLRNTYGLTQISSPLTLIKVTNKALRGGIWKHYELPESKTGYESTLEAMRRYDIDSGLASYVAKDSRLAKLSGKLHDIGGKENRKRLDSFDVWYQANINTDLLDYRMTGYSYLIDKANSRVAIKIVLGLLVAFLVVGLIIGVQFMNIKIIMIALIVNVIPLLLIVSLMYLLGLYMETAIAMVFIIAFGIAVDDTIHFMSRLRLELNKGKSWLYALKRTYLSTGKAIIVTTLVLVTGFLSLVSSEMNSTLKVGVFISSGLIFALISDLLILPALLVVLRRKTKKTK